MALRIEIAIRYDGFLEFRSGDLDGSTGMSNFTKKEILKQISNEIDDLIKEWEKNEKQ